MPREVAGNVLLLDSSPNASANLDWPEKAKSIVSVTEHWLASSVSGSGIWRGVRPALFFSTLPPWKLPPSPIFPRASAAVSGHQRLGNP